MNKRLFPEYRGYEFFLTRLEGWDTPHYGYQLQSKNWAEAGGPYPSKHDATKAAFARIIKDEIFRRLVWTVAELEAELSDAQSECTLQEDIDSLELRITELRALGAFCRRIEEAAKHGRTIKSQLEEPVQLGEGTLAQLKRRSKGTSR